MSIHSVYLVSDLEGSDNGDPLNGIIYCHSCESRSSLVTVLETLKNVLRTKNENQEAFHLQLPLTRYQRFNRPSGLAHASWHRVSQPRGCHDFTFANFAKFANDLKPPPRRRPPSPPASPSQGLPLEEPGPLPPSESASGPPSPGAWTG